MIYLYSICLIFLLNFKTYVNSVGTTKAATTKAATTKAAVTTAKPKLPTKPPTTQKPKITTMMFFCI